VPSGSVEKQHGMSALRDIARDFVEAELHHIGVGVRQREGRPDAAGRADRAEQIGVVIGFCCNDIGLRCAGAVG
jgi:hypothetical protein